MSDYVEITLDPPVPCDDVKPAYSDFDKLLAGMRRINEIDRQIAQARMDMARDVAALISPDQRKGI